MNINLEIDLIYIFHDFIQIVLFHGCILAFLLPVMNNIKPWQRKTWGGGEGVTLQYGYCLILNNRYFHSFVDLIHPSEFRIKDTTKSESSISNLGILLGKDKNTCSLNTVRYRHISFKTFSNS